MLFCDNVIILYIYLPLPCFFVVVLLHSLTISVMLFCDRIILTAQIILYGLERMAVAAMLFSDCPAFILDNFGSIIIIMNILFAATFDVSHEYSAAFYFTRMFR